MRYAVKFGIITVFFMFLSINIAKAEPIGAVIAFAGDTVPSNYLSCDGAEVSRTKYAKLFDAIGTMYGDGDSSSTFNLPDYRGHFLRGVDGGAGNDPDASSRYDRGDGTTGDAVGTYQSDMITSHNHYRNTLAVNYSTNQSNAVTVNPGWKVLSGQQSHPTDDTGGNETRPVNVNVLYCIRWE